MKRARRWIEAAVAFGCLCAASAWAIDERVDRRIPYQGKLSGASASVTLSVELFDEPLGGNSLWGPEEHNVTPDEDGRFVVVIGSSEVDACARLTDGSLECAGTGDSVPDLDQIDPKRLFVEITVIDGSTSTTLSPRQRLFPAFHASSATTGVGVGSVLMWWGRLEDIPPGFELCDGNPPVTPGATLLGNKPDLRGRFVRGAPAGATDVQTAAVTGGTDTKPQTTSGGTVLTRFHLPDYSLPDNLAAASGGNHSHGVSHSCASDEGGGSDTHYALGDSNAGRSCRLSINSGGSHSHSVSGSVQLGGSGQPHTHSVPADDNRPSFLELFFIIRVK